MTDEISNVEEPKTSEQENGINSVTSPTMKLSPVLYNNNNNHSDAKREDTTDEIVNLENSFASFPIEPLQALEGCFDICQDDVATVNPTERDETPLDTEQKHPVKLSLKTSDQETVRDNIKHLGQMKFLQKTTIPGPIKYMSGSLLPDNVHSPKKDHQQPRFRVDRSYSGPLQHLQKNKFTKSLSVDDVPEGPVVQQKGRFKVTEADLNPKAPVLNLSSNGMVSSPTSSIRAASLLPSLQSILQHNTVQREEILRLIKFAEQTHGNPMERLDTGNNDLSQIPLTQKERELHAEVIQLQQSIGNLNEQLMRQKIRNAQLEKKLSDLVKKNSIKE